MHDHGRRTPVCRVQLHAIEPTLCSEESSSHERIYDGVYICRRHGPRSLEEQPIEGVRQCPRKAVLCIGAKHDSVGCERWDKTLAAAEHVDRLASSMGYLHDGMCFASVDAGFRDQPIDAMNTVCQLLERLDRFWSNITQDDQVSSQR